MDNIENRDRLLVAMRRELVGPDPVRVAKSLNLTQPPIFESFMEKKGPWVGPSGEEIISQDTPTKRYGVGVLYPVPQEEGFAAQEARQQEEDELTREDLAPENPDEVAGATGTPIIDEKQMKALEDQREKVEQAVARASKFGLAPEETFDVSGANGYRPSSMAVSFLAEIGEDAVMRVMVPKVLPENHVFPSMAVNGRYRKLKVKRRKKSQTEAPASTSPINKGTVLAVEPNTAQVGKAQAIGPDAKQSLEAGTGELIDDVLYIREQLELEFRIKGKDLLEATGKFLKIDPVQKQGPDALQISLEVLARPFSTQNGEVLRLITVNLVNRSGQQGGDEQCLFQAYFDVQFEHHGEVLAAIHPYPQPVRNDPEEQSNSLLYRKTPTFATGHGCAADWLEADEHRALVVRAECMPAREVPSITPDIKRHVVVDGIQTTQPIDVSMYGLAGLDAEFNIIERLAEVCDAYSEWIEERRSEIPDLPSEKMQATATEHVKACDQALKRMRGGLALLSEDEKAMQAFKWANHAILLQQLRGELKPRPAVFTAERRVYIRGPYPAVTTTVVSRRGNWRAFQIAFLLLSIESAVKGEHPDRETVELIWFPTGGGKTEAYLGLSAFSLFWRRLQDPSDDGVHILMRYTLRLLTAQQFQRASGLICAMEYLRRQNEESLGSSPFSAGIWVGSGTTPNRRKYARFDLKELEEGKSDKNPFLITKCPWCGAEMGPMEVEVGAAEAPLEKFKKWSKGKGNSKKGKAAKQVRALGYRDDGRTVVLHCPDQQCDFSRTLPIYTIDDDVYDERPSLIIGTVDKFASLAWRPEARSLFGWGIDGQRLSSPPGLIIQDELHLISGPLGSVAGLFEGVIEALCTDERGGRKVSPKIVCSTATIRAYREQVKALYARDSTELFPPPGLDVSDSFFAQYARDRDGRLRRGRMYVGVNGPGHGSMQTTQVRTFSSLLQFPMELNATERDPWWTLLTFFNSLRELGTTVTLFQSDIPDYLKILEERYGLAKDQVRRPWGMKELTGRLDTEEVPRAIKDLEVATDDPDHQAADVCLASSIIEVGIDIGRLSLMAIVGQPKTTSQYIQVSGRVGRRWEERPGVVVMLYNASKPRDRSHFEKFRTYHEQLYAQVEPTSVTPFSPPALDRALRAALVAFIRQMAEKSHDGPAMTPKVFPEDLANEFGEMLLERVRKIDAAEVPNVERSLRVAAAEWKALNKSRYQAPRGEASTDPGLLTPAGQYVNPDVRALTWMTPQSMRNVDATCEAKITRLPELDELRRSQEAAHD